MQDLDIISINIWHIVISLANLVILFLILKKLLFKPVKKIVDKRQKELDAEYRKAEKTQAEADAIKAEWEGKMATAEAEADKIISDAVERADSRNEVMLYESREVRKPIRSSVKQKLISNARGKMQEKRSRKRSLTYPRLFPSRSSDVRSTWMTIAT